MTTIYEFPGGVPRFYLDDNSAELLRDILSGQSSEQEWVETVYEFGTGRAMFVVQDRTVFTLGGVPAFWIGEDVADCFLHPFDTTQPTRFYFDLFDRRPGAPTPEERPPYDGLLDLRVRQIGRRAAFEERNNWEAAQKEKKKR